MSKHLLPPLALVLLVTTASALAVAGYVDSRRNAPPLGAEGVAPCGGLVPGEEPQEAAPAWLPPCALLAPRAQERFEPPRSAPCRRS